MPVKSATKQKRTARPHQEEAIAAVVAGFQTQDRGQLLMACGTGKTLTAFWINKRLKAGRTLVLLPSLNLLSQTLKEWEAESSEGLNWIAVCSDKTVAKKGADEWVVNLSDLGIPVTNDPDTIGDFLRQSPNGVVFSTYQSSPLIVEAQEDSSVPDFDLAIADEAHRCAGKVSSAFASVLDEEQIRAGKRLFLTATPRVLAPQVKRKASDENIEVACMDDTAVFGKVFYRLNFSDAIDRDLLSDYQVVIVGVDDPTIRSDIARRSVISTLSGKALDSATLANHIALSKAMKDYSLKRVITFHGRVQGASDFCDLHQSVVNSFSDECGSSQKIKTNFVHGNMPSAERTHRLNQLKNVSEGEVGILTNARCLSEGVDVPALDAIAFIDPRSSVVDIVQAVGRAIRKSKNKSCGYIILPVYLGDCDDEDEEILASRFGEIWKVVLALKSQDDSLSASLDQLRIEQGRVGNNANTSKGLQKIKFDLPPDLSSEFSRSLSARLVRSTTESWKGRYGQLLQFVEKNGHAHVPTVDPTLGRWTHNQRRFFSIGTLSQERIDLLNQVGFVWDAVEASWQEHLSAYSAHRKAGNVTIPEKTPLASWAARQRFKRKKGTLPQEKIDLLNEVDFVWDPLQDIWNHFFVQCSIAMKKGRHLTPRDKDPLAAWVGRQRRDYRKGELPADRIDLLNGINFVWDPVEDYWETKFAEWTAHIQSGGDLVVGPLHPLTSWSNRQRVLKLTGKLSTERIERLESVGFTWDGREYVWQQNYALLERYTAEHGHANVPYSDPQLGTWVSLRRSEKRRGKLSQDRIELLERLNGWSWGR